MAVRQLRYNGDELLYKKCKVVSLVDDRIKEILNDMMDTLHKIENGAALAANQVGILKRLVVIDYEQEYWKLINPEIISYSGEQECIEGCLSFPNQLAKTIRPQTVTIQAKNEKREWITLTKEGEMAKCLCHELEHLDGKVFLDKAIEIINLKE